MPQSLLRGQLKEKSTYRVWCLYSSFVHDYSRGASGFEVRGRPFCNRNILVQWKWPRFFAIEVYNFIPVSYWIAIIVIIYVIMASSNLFPLQSKPLPELPTPSPFTFNFELTFMVPSYQTAYFSVFLIFFVTLLWFGELNLSIFTVHRQQLRSVTRPKTILDALTTQLPPTTSQHASPQKFCIYLYPPVFVVVAIFCKFDTNFAQNLQIKRKSTLSKYV